MFKNLDMTTMGGSSTTSALRELPGGEVSRVLCTVTSYLSLPCKKDAFAIAMGSFVAQHAVGNELSLIDDLYIINEVGNSRQDSEDCERWLHKFLKSFNLPCPVHVIQKYKESEKGQAKSLNMIRKLMKDYDFHIHMEESWFYTSPWVKKGLEIMQSNPITQLQLTPDRWDHPQRYYSLKECDGFNEVFPTEDFKEAIKKFDHRTVKVDDLNLDVEEYWPMYSLRPSINNISNTMSLSLWDEDPKWFPRTFEWKYSLEWQASGQRKGVIHPLAACRFPGHISTYGNIENK